MAHNYEDEPVQKWECIDDRFHSFYGQTYEIPYEDYETDESKIKIAVIGDRFLITDNIYYFHWNYEIDTNLKTLDQTQVRNESYKKHKLQNDFISELKRIYPNATFDIQVDFTDYSSTEAKLEDVISYVENNKVDYVICNGLENTFKAVGKGETEKLLVKLNKLCNEKDIKLMLVCTPTAELLKDEKIATKYTELVNVDKYEFLTVNLLKYLIGHIDVYHKYESYEGVEDWNFHKHDFGWLYSTEKGYGKYFKNYIFDKFSSEYTKRYTEYIYDYIKRRVLQDLFQKKRNSYYISLNHYVISGKNDSLYAKLFGKTGEVDCPEETRNNQTATYKVSDIHAMYQFTSKHCNDGTHWNLFKNLGEFIVVSMSLGYNENVFTCEQFGNTGFRYWHEHNDEVGGVPFNFLPIREWCPGGHEVQMIKPPCFPGTGSSWFVLSNENVEQYTRSNGFFDLNWIIQRDNFNGSIVLNIPKNDKTPENNPDIYSAISFGKFSTTDLNLYIGGGTTGLVEEIYTYYPAGGGNLTYVEGNAYDLNIKSIALSNTDIATPTFFNGAKLSNFNVMDSTSRWRPIFSHVQTSTVEPYPTCGSPPPKFMIHLNEPSEYTGGNRIIKGNFMRHRNIFYIHKLNERKVQKTETRKYNAQLNNIGVNIFDSDRFNEIVGNIGNVFIHYDYEMPLGIVEMEDGIYYNMPCVWDKRLWFYKDYIGIVNEPWKSLDVLKAYEDYIYPMLRNIITHRVIIRLGDKK